jgi:hypothetical protein
MTLASFQLVEWHPATIKDEYHLARDSARVFRKSVGKLPRNFGRQLAKEFSEKYNQYGTITAFKYLRERTSRALKVLREYPLPKTALYREVDRKEIANNLAAHCYETLKSEQVPGADFESTLLQTDSLKNNSQSYAEQLEAKYYQLAVIAKKYKITPPAISADITESMEVALLRLTCARWWARKFEVQARHMRELMQIAAKRVNQKCPYVSHDGLADYRAKQAAMESFLNAFELVCEETEQVVLLSEMAAKSSADPENRRTELMTRLRGMEELAKEKGHQAYFITWTAPAMLHGSSSKWNYSTPKQTQSYLCGQWAKARAKVARKGLEFSGARVTEPHKDGCPHWHMLVFVSEDQAKELLTILREYATQHEKEEIEGNESIRFDVKKLDPNHPGGGSAVGYIAKYIAKNINAAHVQKEQDNDSDLKLDSAAERVRAWASLWNVRQFQFFGAAKVSVWRELRRLKNPQLIGRLAYIHDAADGGRWAEFQKLCEEQTIELEYETEAQAGDYGDALDRVVGVAFLGVVTLTRLLTWVKQKAGAAAKSAEGMENGSSSWTRVSNCTAQPSKVLTQLLNLGYSEKHAKIIEMGKGITPNGVIHQEIIKRGLGLARKALKLQPKKSKRSLNE